MIIDALDRLVNQMRAATDTALYLRNSGIAYPYPPRLKITYPIGQEALTNAIKYARASEIWMSWYMRMHSSLRVKDDGQGFELLASHLVADLDCWE